MRWPWVEQSPVHRYLFAVLVSAVTVLAHWALFMWLQSRLPFLLFSAAIVIVTVLAGRGPATLVVLAGALSASLQFAPTGSLWVSAPVDRLAMACFLVAGVLVLLFGGRLREISARQYHDLEQLHEVSAAVASTHELQEQLDLILQALTAVHGSEKGLVTLYDTGTETLRVIASRGFSDETLARVNGVPVGQGARRLTCIERKRVIIEDVMAAERLATFRDVASQEGIRAVHSTPLLSRSEELLGAISVFLPEPGKPSAREIRLADIYATKAAVAIQRAAAEHLATEGEHRFQTILEASSVPFVILDPIRNEKGRIVDFRWNYVNAAAARALRHSHDELLGQRVKDVLPGAWEESGILQMYEDAMHTNTACEREHRAEADGLVRWFHIIASPLSGTLAVWFADITERKAQEELLRDADRRKDEFLATLAHELRNPLAPIRHAAMIAHSGRASEAQRQWSYSVIERQVQHMALLLEDLLDVSRITRGTLSLKKQITDLDSVISAAVETARPLIDSRHHRLTLDTAHDLRLNVDPLRLSQIISNLLTNAAKYTEPGGTILLSAKAQNGTLTLSVQDSGIGIRERDLPVIFSMFSQLRTGAEHSQGGLGIGLALTRGLVEMHGGSIEARSEGPGKGSTFIVRLPTGEVARPTAAAKAEPTSQMVLSRRILIADDNADAAESLAIVLRLEGHDVVVANDGRAAFDLYREKRPDVALLDLAMPHIDGYELARMIRESEGGKQVCLIAVTGWGQERDRQRTSEAGFDHHLTKPVEPSTLRKLLGPQRKHHAAR